MKIKILVIVLLAILFPCVSRGTSPTITVSATGVSILGTNTTISISVTLIDPNSTGNLRVVGTGVIPIMQASTITPGTTATVGPIYGNDVITDGFGNLNSTYYKVQVFTVTNGIVASTPSLQNFYAFVGSGTVDLATATPLAPSFMTGTNGSVLIPGALTGPNINNVLYVGGPLGTSWGSSDIMAQINAAKTAAPAAGATIYILPQVGGGCYLTNGTTVSFTTVGQYFTLIGVAPISDSNAQIIGGSCIQDQNTSAHNLFTIDWTPSGGGAYAPGAGIQNLAILNSSSNGGTGQCQTPGGCGSSANGIVIGGTNGGAHKGYFANVTVQGFNKGWLLQDAGGIGWGIHWLNSTFAYNVIGLSDTVGHENNKCTGCVFAVNGTNISEANNGIDFTLDGGSVDSATTAGITCSGNSIIYANNVHFENLGQSNIQYMTGTCQLYLNGGVILDDTNGGTAASTPFFTFTHGSMVNFTWSGGVGGRTYPSVAFNPTQGAYIQGFNGNPTAWPFANNVCPVAACGAGRLNITAQNFSFTNAYTLTLSHSAQNVGVSTPSSTFYVRDRTNGGSAIVTADNNPGSVAITNVTGSIVFVVGSPASAQVGFTYAGGFLQITGGSGTGADTIMYTQVITQ